MSDIWPITDVCLCDHYWVDGDSTHSCGKLIEPGIPHTKCECCCGKVDDALWDLPASKTPGVKTRRRK